MISTQPSDSDLIFHEIDRLITEVPNVIGKGWHFESIGLKKVLKSLG